MTTAELERTIGSRIAEAMDRIENPEPNAVAEVVLRQLDPDGLTPAEVRHFAVRGLSERVREVMSRRRRGGGATTSARWGEAARQQASGSPRGSVRLAPGDFVSRREDGSLFTTSQGEAAPPARPGTSTTPTPIEKGGRR